MIGAMGTLFVIATPIGNLEDVSLRSLRTLRGLDVLACEDTRVTRRLLQRYAIPAPARVVAYHEHNEQRVGPSLLAALDEGAQVGLCSDGGCPGISDPGYRIIQSALEEGHAVTVLPGPCAVETALLAGGMPTSSYTFLGFPPPKSGKRRNWFAAEGAAPHTLVVYESPKRIGKTLADAAAVLSDRRAAVCIELTKKFERVERGWLYDLAAAFADRAVKGEITLVIAGNNPKFIRAGGADGGGAGEGRPPRPGEGAAKRGH